VRLVGYLKINIILPVVLYGCETCPLTLRDEYGVRVFKNRMLKKIFVHKNDEVIGSREDIA
jgi:hypothetical protein